MCAATKRSSALKYNKLALGFHLDPDEIVEAEQGQFLQSSDAWEVFVGILLACQSGKLTELSRIPELMRQYEDWLFWQAATSLVGYAGSWSFVNQFFEEFQVEIDDPGVQYFLSIALANSGGLWVVEPLLTLHEAAVDEERRHKIEGGLASLLEEEGGPLWDGADEETVISHPEDPSSIECHTIVDYASYAKKVRAARDNVVDLVGSMDKAVREGRLLDIVGTSKRLYQRLTSDAVGPVGPDQMFFEATTGIDCSRFYDEEGNTRFLSAAAILEDFLESDAVNRFEPGRRYFFGHPISD